MKGWMLAAGGGVVAALLAVGVLASVQDGPKPATAQNPPTTTTGAASGPSRTVTVDGVGVVSGTPDTVTLSLGVQVEATSATEALDEASRKAAALIDTLTTAGVGKPDIQTGYLSVYPRYRDGTSEPNGYSASNSVTAVVHDVDRAGAIIDAAANAVGDGITMGGVSFSIDDKSTLYEQARRMAVGEAQQHAEQLASAANVSVGGVVSMNESAQELPTPMVARDSAGGVTSAAAAPAPIEPGRQEVQLRVQVVFELA
jgi:uncharacterized protein YggE